MAEPKPHQLKHLDYIQAIITRMAQHSFTLKGWCISLVLAFIAVLIREGATNPLYWTPPIPIICCFWGLDAYYLRREKLFRALYDKVSHEVMEQRPAPNMLLDVSFLVVPRWRRLLFNHTVWPLYVVPALLIAISAVFLRPQLRQGEPKPTGGSAQSAAQPAQVTESQRWEGARKPFEEIYSEIMRSATPEQRYRFLYALPKGADLHHHLNQSILPAAWLAGALRAEQTHGNIFYTRTRLGACPDQPERRAPQILYHTIQHATYEKLSSCERAEYEPLTTLSPAARTEWLSALTIDKPGEGREEFFEVLSSRLGDLSRDPYLVGELLVDNMRRFGAEGVRYLEVQVVGPRFLEKDGRPMEEERAVQYLSARVAQPDARATGVTVRFLAAVVRLTPNAEQELERAFERVSGHRDAWVGVNLTGREDKDAGRALRFVETFRKLRRAYGGIRLALHGGESELPGSQIHDTLLLGADRLGHALNLTSDPSTLLFMRSGRFLIETSLISNRLLGYVPEPSTHPFAEYLRLGIPVCLNTDDRGSFGSSMTDEYYTAVTSFNMRWSEVKQVTRNSLLSSFADAALKDKLLRSYEASISDFEARFTAEPWPAVLARVDVDVSDYARRNLGVGTNTPRP